MDLIESLLPSFVRAAYSWGWHLKEAKYGRRGAQSLLAHSLNAVSICYRLGRILNWPEDRLKLIMASRAFHDMGKTRWDKRGAPPKALTSEERELMKKFLKEMNFSEEEIKGVISLAQKDEAPHSLMELRSLSSKKPINLDDLDLARIADVIASLKDPTDSLSRSEMKRLRRLGLSLAAHKVGVVRGVSTQLLHSAMERLYKEAGFEPVLYFHSGTVYAGKGDPPEFTREKVLRALREEIVKYIDEFADRASAAAIGSVNKSPIKLPEFIFISEESGVNFVHEVISRIAKVSVSKRELEGEGFGALVSKDVEPGVRESRIKLYKGLKYLLTYLNRLISFSRDFGVESPEDVVSSLFKKHFGCDPPNGLTGIVFQTPNEKAVPVIDELLGALGVERISLEDALDKIKPFAEDLARQLVLLSKNAGKVSLGEEVLLDDLVYPLLSDPSSIAEESFEAYSEGKEKPNTPVCPICGRPADEVGRAELHGDGVQAFNNLLRGGSSLSTSNKVWFCKACDLEAKLRALLLDNWQEGEVLFFVPMVNSTQDLISILWESSIDVIMKAGYLANVFNDRVWSHVVLNHEEMLAASKKLWESVSRELRTYLSGESKERRKEIIKKVEKCLEELYESPQEASSYLGVPGDEFREVAEHLVEAGEVPDDCLRQRGSEAAIPSMRAGNYIVLITRQHIGLKDEPEACRNLRRLFFAVLFGILFQTAVMYSPLPLSVLSVDLGVGGYAEVPRDVELHEVIERLGLRERWVDIPSSENVLRRLASLIAASYEAFNLYGENNLLRMAKTHPGEVLARLTAEGRRPSADMIERLGEYWGVV